MLLDVILMHDVFWLEADHYPFSACKQHAGYLSYRATSPYKLFVGQILNAKNKLFMGGGEYQTNYCIDFKVQKFIYLIFRCSLF